MTFTEYLTYKAPAGFKDELIHGEIRLSPSAKADHQEICKRLERMLDEAISSTFIAQRDTTIYVAGGEGPRPDVFVIRKDRWGQALKSQSGRKNGDCVYSIGAVAAVFSAFSGIARWDGRVDFDKMSSPR